MSLSNDAKPENYAVNARICQLVAQCPFMYDRSHLQYLKKEVCEEAWQRIAKEMGESVSTCRERWRNIRTSFARSINTNKVACRANRTKPYYLHEELKFLLDYITPGVPVVRRYKKKTTSNGESGGEESELIEVSVGEDTFNGFEHLSCTYGENGDTQTETTHDGSKWQQHNQQQLQQNNNCNELDGENGGVHRHHNEPESCDSSLAEERLHTNHNKTAEQQAHEDCNANSRLAARLPPPPLQAAPLAAFQRGADETEAAAALQQIQMSSMPLKRPRLETQNSNTASDASAINFLAEQQRRASRCGNGNSPGCALEIGGGELKLSNEANADAGFLQELQMEMRGMDRRQTIHFKRRIYEALAEIFPLNNMHTNNNEYNSSSIPIAQTSYTAAAALPIDITTTATAGLVEMPRPIVLPKPQLNINGTNVSTQVTRQDLNTNWPAKRVRSEAVINGNHDAGSDAAVQPSPTTTATSKRHSTKSAAAARASLNESSTTVAITRSATAERRSIRPFNHAQSQQQQQVKDEPDGSQFSD